jgi:hypothetical protein
MDFGGLIALGVLWLFFNLLSKAGSKTGGTARRGPTSSGPRPLPPTGGDPAQGDATQREGSRLERLLRELERGLDQMEQRSGPPVTRPAATLPPPTRPADQLPEAEEVEERDSLEQPERVVSLEREVPRGERPTYDQDLEAEGIARRRIAAAEARSGALTRADHKAFDRRIREEPADHTAVRRYTPAQLRHAIVWREILGPPVSERDP